MVNKNSKYTIYNERNLPETHHFETNAEMALVLTAGGESTGNVHEQLFEGVIKQGGTITSLTIAGTYKVSNMTDYPSGVPKNTTALLLVKTQGEIASPEIIYWQLITPDGEIFHKHKFTSSEPSEWLSSGKTVQQGLESASNAIGSISTLDVKSSTNIVEALNIISKDNVKLSSTVKNLKTQIDNHNHDDRYVRINEFESMVRPLENKLKSHNFDSRYIQMNGNGSMKILDLGNSSTKGKLRFKATSYDTGTSLEATKRGVISIYTSENSYSPGIVLDANNKSVSADNYMIVNGRRIYLQSDRPVGQIPTGSIWLS